MKIKTRSQAKMDGDKTYISGSTCSNGHKNAERRTDSGSCVLCVKSQAEKSKERQLRFKEKNHERLKEIKRESMRRARASDPEKHRRYARERMRDINKTCQGKLRQFIKGALRRTMEHKGGSRSYDVVGYGYKELRSRIESLFSDGMSWENYGEWHIDHIKPIKAFLDEGITDPSVINALSNLQPLWAFDNISKGANYSESE